MAGKIGTLYFKDGRREIVTVVSNAVDSDTIVEVYGLSGHYVLRSYLDVLKCGYSTIKYRWSRVELQSDYPYIRLVYTDEIDKVVVNIE